MLQVVSNMADKPAKETIRMALKSQTPQLKVRSGTHGTQPLPDYCVDRSISAALAEEHRIATIPKSDGTWRAYTSAINRVFAGETPAMASMRCKAGAVLGMQPEVPDELVEWEISDQEIDDLLDGCLHQNVAHDRPTCS
ncbi:MAG: hypothetical protein Q7V53_02790 [Caldisericota bacterium]|nr:hypothetical protein [Caldisericota bacterium]